MSKKIISSLSDLESTFYDSLKFRILNRAVYGPVLYYGTICILALESVRFRFELKSILMHFQLESLLDLSLKISIHLILGLAGIFLLIFLLMPVGIFVQKKRKWEYTEAVAIDRTKSEEKTYLYNKMNSIVVDGRIRAHIEFDNSPNFSRVAFTSWYGKDSNKFYEFVDFLITKKVDIRNNIYIRIYKPFKGQIYIHVPPDKWKETLSEYFASIKFQ